ncbi:MAG TPA: type VI secretion system-associated protein TagF [Stellaceae bacterium]|jgi:type VI secretion system protein ImpM
MPAAVTGGQALVGPGAAGVLRRAAIGFYGKIPARGDFVRAGLPRSFVEPWDEWLRGTLAQSRAELGSEWLSAWLEAPVWRFALMPGSCGPDPVLGLWMPSVDRAGRYFPLTLAAVMPEADPRRLIAEGGGFLAAAESAGRDALADDLHPEALAARLLAAASAPAADPGVDAQLDPPAGALWWTEGAPRVVGGSFLSFGLPDAAKFAAMLDARAGL